MTNTSINKEVLFQTVLNANKSYVDAISRRAEKEEQESLLAYCRTVFQMVLDAKLANEFAEFCNTLNVKEGR